MKDNPINMLTVNSQTETNCLFYFDGLLYHLEVPGDISADLKFSYVSAIQIRDFFIKACEAFEKDMEAKNLRARKQ